jgi:hypothetical protein
VRVILYGQGQAGCTKLNQEAAAASETFWKTRPAGYVVEGSEVVCSMTKNGILIEVRDTREHFEGNHICANLQGRGWSEKEGPARSPKRSARRTKLKSRRATNNTKPKLAHSASGPRK